MTTNHDIAATWTYHNGTKHSLQSVRNDPHYLDWENQPLPFKIYSTLEPLPLPHALPPVQMPTLTALSATRAEQRGAYVPEVPALAAILFLSAGITKRRPYPGAPLPPLFLGRGYVAGQPLSHHYSPRGARAGGGRLCR